VCDHSLKPVLRLDNREVRSWLGQVDDPIAFDGAERPVVEEGQSHPYLRFLT
jgi:hypothetical protein